MRLLADTANIKELEILKIKILSRELQRILRLFQKKEKMV